MVPLSRHGAWLIGNKGTTVAYSCAAPPARVGLSMARGSSVLASVPLDAEAINGSIHLIGYLSGGKVRLCRDPAHGNMANKAKLPVIARHCRPAQGP
ncbi:hypothetical protein [Alicyclobacillus dauci]|uniref:Uncharacterized protein n=1 Tax=Alicyclobacillus dauci TaxID=1475485 RepID=A0ABY6Z2W1_9BACL|nr:hypothetical protein [Alicyclobacillus dauci]WAH36858.1 hypothetical protein NZD86_22260 [Alicyclobacillus dauci]